MTRRVEEEALSLSLILYVLTYADSSKVDRLRLTSSKWLFYHIVKNPWCVENVEFVYRKSPLYPQLFVSRLILRGEIQWREYGRGAHRLDKFPKLKHLTVLDEDGVVTECSEWRGGCRHGKCTSGHLSYHFLRECMYEDGVLNGPMTTRIITHTHPLALDDAQNYQPTTSLINKCTYKDGVRVGIETESYVGGGYPRTLVWEHVNGEKIRVVDE